MNSGNNSRAECEVRMPAVLDWNQKIEVSFGFISEYAILYANLFFMKHEVWHETLVAPQLETWRQRNVLHKFWNFIRNNNNNVNGKTCIYQVNEFYILNHTTIWIWMILNRPIATTCETKSTQTASMQYDDSHHSNTIHINFNNNFQGWSCFLLIWHHHDAMPLSPQKNRLESVWDLIFLWW